MKQELLQQVVEWLPYVWQDPNLNVWDEEIGLRSYSTWDYGRERDSNNLSLILIRQAAESILPQLRREAPEGLVVFLGTNDWLGEEQPEGIEVVFAEGQSQFDILRIARTQNDIMDTEDLIRKLKAYDDAFGINILGATDDTVDFVLYHLPEDLTAFAEDVYDMCGDVQHPDNVEAAVRTFMRVSLWWD